MTLDEIKALGPQILEMAADDCALFSWAIDTMTPEALEVIKAWGFTFKTKAFTWVKLTRKGKQHFGMGFWTRQNTESCYLAVRGHPKRLDKLVADMARKRSARSVREVIMSPIGQHSEKPDEIYERIERLVSGPYVELFSRKSDRGGMWL
jgi:N6-adenosine-specific RNA methylase IME4